ncbi:uncharacterized protein EV154DRAFT_531485 [Mucor mucedo]|uniref:uncharacterized protein n=1 Tax=Mucor mucedo TaxID=29922 RepID=UPI002220155C|nr:uncharacterized protein EV154DRAFT_531485 [Mucor mucedo]KAI7868206.1 hypothetical protein EV154DRAFT_531485 [Mucor mucedo]
MEKVIEVHKQALAVSEAVAAVNRLWDEVYTKHQQDVSKAIKMGHQVHVAFYRFLEDIYVFCNSSSLFLTNIVEEMEIAKRNRKFDTTSVSEIERSTTIMSGVLNTKREQNERLTKDMSNSMNVMNVDKKSLETILEHYSSLRTAIESVSVGAAIGAYTTPFFSSIGAVATVGLLPLWPLIAAVISGGFVAYIKYLKKEKLAALAKLMESIFDKMVDLQQRSKKFEDSLGGMAEVMKGLTTQVKKVMRCSQSPEEDSKRVVELANNMLKDSENLKGCFKKMGEEVTSGRSSLRCIIVLHDPYELMDE